MTENVGAVEITAEVDTKKVGPELSAGVRKAVAEAESEDLFKPLEEAAGKAGEKAGQNLGDGLIRDAQGRIRDAKTGRFVQTAEDTFSEIGKKAGEAAARGTGDELENGLLKRIRSLSGTLAPPFVRTIGAWVVALTPVISQLGAVLLPAVGLLAGIIPVAIGAAASLGILHVAFNGVGKAIKDINGPAKTFQADLKKLGPGARAFVLEIKGIQKPLKQFRDQIQESFFGKFAGTVTMLAKTLLPALHDVILSIASTLGGIGKAIGETLVKSSSIRSLRIILAGVNSSLQDAGKALVKLIPALLTIGEKVTPLIVGLAEAFTKVSDQFGKFVDKSAKTGRLDDFFVSTKEALKLILVIGEDAYTIVKSLLDAGKQAGGGGEIIGVLTTLAGVFKELDKTGGLAAVFEVFNTAFADLGKVIAPLIPSISKFLLALGKDLGKDLTTITPGLTDLVKHGLVPLLDAFTKALPVINPVVNAILSLVNSLAKNKTAVTFAVAAFVGWFTLVAYKNIAGLFQTIALAIQEQLIPALFEMDVALDANPVGLFALAIEAVIAGIILVSLYINQMVQRAGGWKKLWNEFTFYLKFGADAIAGWAEAAWNWVVKIAGGIATFGKSVWAVVSAVFGAIPSAIDEALNRAAILAHKGLKSVLSFIAALPLQIENYGIRIFKAGVSLAKSFGEGIVHGLSYISGVAKSIYGALKGYINDAIGSVNSGIGHVAGFLHIGIPSIPKLANGTITNGPMVATLGESGREVVIPLTRPQRAAKLLRDSGLAAQLGMGQPAVNVAVYIGAERLDDRIDTRVAVANDDTSDALAHGTRGF